MNRIIIVLAIFVTVSANFDIIREWNEYKRTYGKSYYILEDVYRKALYIANRNQIRLHNLRFDRGCETYQLGINQFSDRTYAEYANIFEENAGLIPGGNAFPPVGQCNNENNNNGLPWENYDWRPFGAVSNVQDQGIQCNSGWAFASLSSLESRNFVSFGTLPQPLSPQNLIDCITPSSCSSKTPADVFTYVVENQNVNTESLYPYQGKPGSCRYNPTDIGATCADFRNLTGTEIELQNTVKNAGPAVAEIDPLSFTFMHYKSGVYRPALNRRPSNGKHYMTIVGLGNDPQKGNYWLMKNSFGTNWGESGYIRLASTQTNKINSITYPIV